MENEKANLGLSLDGRVKIDFIDPKTGAVVVIVLTIPENVDVITEIWRRNGLEVKLSR